MTRNAFLTATTQGRQVLVIAEAERREDIGASGAWIKSAETVAIRQ